MSIQAELSRIINAKAAIKAAIEGKGVTVPDATLLDGMAALIESIEAGGGGDFDFSSFGFPISKSVSGTFIPNNDTQEYVLVHNLGITPKIIIIICMNSLSLIGLSKRTIAFAAMFMNRFYNGAFPTEVISDPLYMYQVQFSLPSSSSTYFSSYGINYQNDGVAVSKTSEYYNPFFSSSGSNCVFKTLASGGKYEEKSKEQILIAPRVGSSKTYLVGGVEYSYFCAG